MADKLETTAPTPDPSAEKTPEQVEEEFWAKHKTATVGILDEWFEKKKEELRTVGTSRSGGRTSLPGIIANIMFGEPKQ